MCNRSGNSVHQVFYVYKVWKLMNKCSSVIFQAIFQSGKRRYVVTYGSLTIFPMKTKIPRIAHLFYEQVHSCMCQCYYSHRQLNLYLSCWKGKTYNNFQACRNPVTGALKTRSGTAVSLSGVRSVNETELLAYGKWALHVNKLMEVHQWLKNNSMTEKMLVIKHWPGGLRWKVMPN